MAKAVFRPGEVEITGEKVILQGPEAFELSWLAGSGAEEKPEDIFEEEVYAGPTAEDLRREADEFRRQWEAEKEMLLADAREEAERIRQDAEEAAREEAERQEARAREEKQRAGEEAERIIAEAERKAVALETEAHSKSESSQKEAETKGRETGREEGFAEGKAEAERLIARLHTVLERAQGKREEILEDTEQQIVDLVLLIARKVVKSITSGQKDVVIQNVTQALRKVKARGNIFIRVNLADLSITTEHTKDFVELMESAANIQVLEDSSVDQGGCIVETDFGEIDARISSQLAELESKILELSPQRESGKSGGNGNGSFRK